MTKLAVRVGEAILRLLDRFIDWYWEDDEKYSRDRDKLVVRTFIRMRDKLAALMNTFDGGSEEEPHEDFKEG